MQVYVTMSGAVKNLSNLFIYFSYIEGQHANAIA